MIKEKVQSTLEKKIKNWFIKNPKRVYFTIDKKDLKEIAKILYVDFSMRLSTVSAMDNEENFELVYHFGYDKTGEMFNARLFIDDKNKPEVDSLVEMFKSTDWVEREIHEMLGINFIGHPNLMHLLLDHDWPKDSFPLRKDFTNDKGYPLENNNE